MPILLRNVVTEYVPLCGGLLCADPEKTSYLAAVS